MFFSCWVHFFPNRLLVHSPVDAVAQWATAKYTLYIIDNAPATEVNIDFIVLLFIQMVYTAQHEDEYTELQNKRR